MGDSPFLSVVIPTYNVEKYITATLGSIMAQPYKDYEIIIVDDGSNDNTTDICLEIKKSNPSVNIEVYKLPHGGVSRARNYGIRKSRGQYIHFMDSDDELLPDMYGCFFEQAKRNSYDLIIGGVNILKPLGVIKQNLPYDVDCPIKSKLVGWLRNITVEEKDWMLNVVWNKWFKRELIIENTLEYKDICPGEDYEFVMRYLSLCKSVYVVSKPVYNYYQRGSVSLLNRRYSHGSQIERRTVNWETTQVSLAEIGVFNPSFLIAEGYSLYSAMCADMNTDSLKKTLLEDYFSLKQYDCLPLYFKTRRTLACNVVSLVFASRNSYLIRMYFRLKNFIKR